MTTLKTPYNHVPLLNTPVDLSYSKFLSYSFPQGFPCGTAVRISLPIPGEGNENPLQYFCLGNPMDRGAWRATVHRLQRVRHDLATKQQQKHSLSP